MTQRRTLDGGWQLARTAPGAVAAPEGLAAASLAWSAGVVPGTVAEALGHDIDLPGPFDAHDWWFRTTFEGAPAAAGTRDYLAFDGLATLAQAWLNGREILVSRNMFRRHRVDVTGLLAPANELVIRFASLDAALAQRRPRPRWKTALVRQQNLRWFRTTFLGRMPGWAPSVALVGPWRAVALERVAPLDVHAVQLQPRAEGKTGRLRVRALVAPHAQDAIEAARIRVGAATSALEVRRAADGIHVEGEAVIADVPLWWPHTHGDPALVECTLELRVAGAWRAHDCGRVGFRALSLDNSGGAVRFRVNGVPVFCRGACWTTMDVVSPSRGEAGLRAALEAARDAGLNMMRIGGTMAYETDAFYRACDELGILVWQDFMFANMDYPVADPEFRAEIDAEAAGELDRLQRHACIAAYCGGSEVAQQAAMMGLPEAQWSNEFFRDGLREACAQRHPGIPYFPSTPWGGALPFHVGEGIAHYYGVGAYRRPLSDARRARAKFVTESLGFSHLPEADAVERTFGSAAPPPHLPRWKARVPRDGGAGWDFEDIRDHYLEALFGVRAVELRSQDLERYHDLSRVVPGEVMQQVFSEWRAPQSGCGGALVWHYRDAWPGAGWGITDSDGRPKAAWWYLRRAWAARAVRVCDEGLDGLSIHVLNDAPAPLAARVEVETYRRGHAAMAPAAADIDVPAHGAQSLGADALLGRFTDIANAYRFGPPKHDVVAVRLVDRATGAAISEDFHFPAGHDLPVLEHAQVRVEAREESATRVVLTVESDAFLQAVSLVAEGWTPEDNHFHLVPGRARAVRFAARGTPSPFRVELRALNLAQPLSAYAARPAAGVAALDTSSR